MEELAQIYVSFDGEGFDDIPEYRRTVGIDFPLTPAEVFSEIRSFYNIPAPDYSCYLVVTRPNGKTHAVSETGLGWRSIKPEMELDLKVEKMVAKVEEQVKDESFKVSPPAAQGDASPSAPAQVKRPPSPFIDDPGPASLPTPNDDSDRFEDDEDDDVVVPATPSDSGGLEMDVAGSPQRRASGKGKGKERAEWDGDEREAKTKVASSASFTHSSPNRSSQVTTEGEPSDLEARRLRESSTASWAIGLTESGMIGVVPLDGNVKADSPRNSDESGASISTMLRKSADHEWEDVEMGSSAGRGGGSKDAGRMMDDGSSQESLETFQHSTQVSLVR
ncbi:hypothetical protein MNV49_000745 [Pseudohyphozyma bogoriensis]|nr:hypothetical protein MNV49_000745 [Pseudohyphozyma bogoriensis]